MSLSTDLISQFVKITRDETPIKEDSFVYGTIKKDTDGKMKVLLDGSSTLVPVDSTSDMTEDGVTVNARVIVLIKNHRATVIGNLSQPSASVQSLEGVKLNLEKVEKIEAENVEINETLTAHTAKIGTLEADNVKVNNTLTSVIGKVTYLEANSVTTENLKTNYLTAEQIKAKYVDTEKLESYVLESTFGEFEDLTTEKLTAHQTTIDELEAKDVEVTGRLDAAEADIDDLEANVADIDTLIFGSASGNTMHVDFANAVIALLGDAWIKSAMIESISADKISAGDILTNNVRILSEDGSLVISDETIQISDGNRVRVQIGKDEASDYSINVWDQNGNLMFSKGGITDAAIKDAIIRDDMVSDAANISAHKLNIDSLFEEINDNDSNTIKSTKIYLDDKKQTLDVAFKSLETSVTEQGETISAQYSALEQDVDGISATVAEHATKIEDKADSSTVKTVSDKVVSLEQNLNGFQTTVSDTYATKTMVNGITIGGRNLFHGYGDEEIRLPDYNGVGSFMQFNDCLTFDPAEFVGKQFTLSFYAKSPNGPTTIRVYNQNGQPRYFNFAVNFSTQLGDEWTYHQATFSNSDLGEAYTTTHNRLEFYGASQTGVVVKKIKLEMGNRATDWTPAPEDMGTAKDVDRAQTTADEALDTATTAETLVQQLSDSISMLVTDGNGTSLMTQTDDGWVFSTSDIQTSIDRVSESLNSLTNDVGDINGVVDILQQTVDDLGATAEYIRIGTYEDEPCIELGESDSDFKLIITNTRILFMEGTSVPAYINNQSLHITKAVIEEEIQQGEFVWKVRANGNMGLMWKGEA